MSSRSRKGRSSIRRRGANRKLFAHKEGRSCSSGKRVFASRQHAQNALLILQSKYGGNLATNAEDKFTCVAVYKCKSCHMWHHTSKGNRKTAPQK